MIEVTVKAASWPGDPDPYDDDAYMEADTRLQEAVTAAVECGAKGENIAEAVKIGIADAGGS